jgi:hypothetical protein
MTDTPNSDTNPIAAAEIEPGDVKREHAACNRKRNAGERQEAVAQRIEQAVKQHENHQQADMITSSRALACCSSSNSPAHSIRYPQRWA